MMVRLDNEAPISDPALDLLRSSRRYDPTTQKRRIKKPEEQLADLVHGERIPAIILIRLKSCLFQQFS